MTIFVTWQLIVTLDSFRNSCDVLFLLFHYHYHNCWYHYNFVNYIIIWSIVLSMASFFGSTNQSNLWQEMNNKAKVDIITTQIYQQIVSQYQRQRHPKHYYWSNVFQKIVFLQYQLALSFRIYLSSWYFDSWGCKKFDKHADGGICVIFGSVYSLVIHCTQVILLWVLFFLGQIHLNIYNNNYKMTSIQQVVEMNAG